MSETVNMRTGPITMETDTNGNGIVGDGETPSRSIRMAGMQCEDAPWVDTNGNFWFPYATLNGVTGTAELPLTGFDSENNPLYNWNNAIIVCPDTSLDVRYDPNYNRLFMLTSVPERVAGTLQLCRHGDRSV